jgi:hypothetical protein
MLALLAVACTPQPTAPVDVSLHVTVQEEGQAPVEWTEGPGYISDGWALVGDFCSPAAGIAIHADTVLTFWVTNDRPEQGIGIGFDPVSYHFGLGLNPYLSGFSSRQGVLTTEWFDPLEGARVSYDGSLCIECTGERPVNAHVVFDMAFDWPEFYHPSRCQHATDWDDLARCTRFDEYAHSVACDGFDVAPFGDP